MFTICELIELSGLSERTIWTYLKKNEISPASKKGHAHLFSPEILEDLKSIHVFQKASRIEKRFLEVEKRIQILEDGEK